MGNWLTTITIVIYAFQLLSLIAVVFMEKKDPKTTLSWMIVLLFIPVVGFIFYIFLGRGLSKLSHKKLKLSRDLQQELHTAPPRALEYFSQTHDIVQNKPTTFVNQNARQYTDLIKMNYYLTKAPYTENNTLQIYTNAKEQYEDLFADIRAAKQYIHLCYFIVSNTNISHELIALLAEKAREGVEVRFIYDELGNLFVPRRMFDPIKHSGGKVYRFFPLSPSNLLHANYRNHHKIVVIDGQIGYTGGMNIGDEYMGYHARKTPWRDTHMRIRGDSVASLEFLFLIDLFYVTNNRAMIEPFFSNHYFPKPEQTGSIGMQIVSSGPDDDSEAIKRAYVKLINSAKSTLYLQSPYLMPDETVMEAIQNAAASGVKVQLMLPGIPDKRIVYQVTISYIATMLDYGVEVYIYPGFLHAKMLVADDKICTIGTTNLDIRSLHMHFEVNNFIYTEKIAKQCGDIFREDLAKCTQMTPERYHNRGILRRFMERIFRLFAPLM